MAGVQTQSETAVEQAGEKRVGEGAPNDAVNSGSEQVASGAPKDVASENGEPESEESTQPHPLQFSWSLWHDQPGKNSKSWGTELRNVASFATVEEFWSLFNNLLEPSRLPAQNTYSLFKSGIKPEWEDPALANGGEWRVQVPPGRRELLDQFWVDTVLTLIGEGFEAAESDDIAGIVVNIRRGANRIAIWTKSATEENLQRMIGNRWRQVAVQQQGSMEYFSFSSLKGGSKKRAAYTA